MLGFNYFKEQYISLLAVFSFFIVADFSFLFHLTFWRRRGGGGCILFSFLSSFIRSQALFFICPTLSSFCPFALYIVLTGRGRSMKWLDTFFKFVIDISRGKQQQNHRADKSCGRAAETSEGS